VEQWNIVFYSREFMGYNIYGEHSRFMVHVIQ
jgi:hypothetical protein